MSWMRTKRTINKKVKSQMMMVFVAVAMIPMLLLGIFSVHLLRSQMKRSYEMQLEAECTRVKGTLFDITASMYSCSEPIVSVQTYRDLFGAEGLSENEKTIRNALTRSILSLKQSTAAISSIHIYHNNPNLSSNTALEYVASFDGEEWYQKLNKENWDNWIWTTAQINRTQQDEELTLVRRINTGFSGYRAYLVLTISSNHLRNRILTTDSFIMASLGDFNCIFSSDYKEEGKIMPRSEVEAEDHYNYLGTYQIRGKKALVKTSTFQAYNMPMERFYILTADEKAYGQIDALTKLLVVILCSAFAVVGTSSWIFTSSFSRRVETLRSMMNQASQGDYDIVDEFWGEDELAEIFDDLKQMICTVREKEAQYYKTKLEEQHLLNMQQEMEFKMLCSQINPHFLYNTLELIRMQAISQRNRNVADSILLLAKSMHYVLENTGTDETTLEKEFDHVKIYLQIQQMRFGSRVNWDFYVESGMNPGEYQILPLLIQPVVENAIVHGLEAVTEEGHISIIVERENGTLVITVRDNGAGLDGERLSQVKEYLKKKQRDQSRSIGLYNVNQRIKVRYGEEYGIQIESEPYAGTSVILTIPLIRRNEADNVKQKD